ncbi:hypothetical protein [Burkholderia sp. NRF60-BP8]|uniref:hypothetical protein n=1 Tax=Burkholderia sp. NRF60-BP8 TaxID=1637853 RepID=UPI00131F3F8D|nr:hypothetical protein [Burkholderia sp. NRF60-BP8]
MSDAHSSGGAEAVLTVQSPNGCWNEAFASRKGTEESGGKLRLTEREGALRVARRYGRLCDLVRIAVAAHGGRPGFEQACRSSSGAGAHRSEKKSAMPAMGIARETAWSADE